MDWEDQRDQMVKRQLVSRGLKDERVLEAMGKVPRHLFVPENLRENAYHDGPLYIGEGQTISQPYMVALMTECLDLKGGEKVLEVGTGSGYQTAILAELAEHVYTIERVPILLEKAQQVLTHLGYTTIKFKGGDGTYGWREESPFDGIIVTAAAPDISQVLVEQLNDGEKGDKTEKEKRTLCVFVPLIGKYGWKEN